MVLVLPYDVWCLIAKFIPKLVLLKLYSVNSAFFDLVMNEQYREVRTYHIADEQTRRCLANMSPLVATRVRSLKLHPHLFGKHLNSNRSIGGKKLNAIRQAGRPIKSTTILQHISHMTEVTSLTIACYHADDFRLFNSHLVTSLSTTVWPAHGSRLRSLTLAIPLEGYPSILVTPPVLESLESLSITLRVVYLTTMYEEIYPLIITFIDRHSRTLHTLSVDTPVARVNPFNFFNNLGRLPHLKKLSIWHPLNRLRPQSPTGIDSFLIKHTDLLRELSILICDILATYLAPLPTPDELFTHPIFQVHMPHLTSLELGLLQWTGAIHRTSISENLMKYLRPMRKTLSRLALRNHALTFPEMQSIVAVVGGTESQLRSLEIHMYFLSCDLFDILSQKLPRLHHLEVGFELMKNLDDGAVPNYPNYFHWYNAGTDPRASSFLEGMADRRYSDWSLRHLAFPTRFCSGKWDETRAALVVALPSVITFNGLSASEFVKTPDFTKPY